MLAEVPPVNSAPEIDTESTLGPLAELPHLRLPTTLPRPPPPTPMQTACLPSATCSSAAPSPSTPNLRRRHLHHVRGHRVWSLRTLGPRRRRLTTIRHRNPDGDPTTVGKFVVHHRDRVQTGRQWQLDSLAKSSGTSPSMWCLARSCFLEVLIPPLPGLTELRRGRRRGGLLLEFRNGPR